MLKTSASDDKLPTLLSNSQIKIIDLAHCGTEEYPIKSVVNRVAAQLKTALSEKGMALLVNHGISEEKLKKAYTLLDSFCKLPDTTKEKYLRKGSENHGYVRPGQEKFDGKTKDMRHAYNICQIAKLPEEPGFTENIDDLTKDFKNLSRLLLQSLAISLEMPSSFFTEKHSHMLDGENENETTFRLLYYPPLIIDDDKTENMKGSSKYCHQKTEFDEKSLGKLNIKDDEFEEEHVSQADVINKTVTRCGAHCDYGTFTLLAQDAEGGLEVQLPGSEKWQRVGHLPGAIFINTGELLSIWTQGKFPALPHRVVIPEESFARNKARHSIAFFVHPDNETPIIPIDLPATSSSEELVDDKEKKRKRSFKAAKTKIYNAYQHVQRRFKESYAS